MGELRVLDLFSGIGGFSLGLERTEGFQTVAFCEIDPFCRRVLAKHWPEAPCYDDVRTLTAGRLKADGISVDVICGGFPCQDISLAGKGAGIDGSRSGLWSEYARLIGELRPDWVVIENVPALRTRGADRVLADLEAAGYSCEPAVVGSVHVGAPHRRLRAWLVAYPRSVKHKGVGAAHERTYAPKLPGAYSGNQARRERMRLYPAGQGQNRRRTEPDVGRVAYGIPNRVDRLRALGNAVDPDVPEIIGKAILNAITPQAGS